MNNQWDEKYAADRFYYGKTPNLHFKEELDKLEPGRLLLPAEGEGRNAVYAAKAGWNVTCFDWSEEGKKKADKFAAEEGVKLDYRVSDFASFNYGEGEYDAVGLVFVHLPPDEREELHKNVVKSLKQGGKLIFTAYDKTQLGKTSGGPKDLNQLYSLEQIVEDFIDLEFEVFAKESLVLDEGPAHSGLADLIKFSGRKK